MDDLISRQAAIRIASGYCHPANIAKELAKLPSAQQWIPCSERLPKEDTYVLATTEWGEITMAEKLSDNAWFIYEGNANAKSDDIVAWMPLPEPYREDSHE